MSDDTLHDMKIDLSTGKDALQELYGEGYFGRVYRTSLAVFALIAMMVAVAGRGLPALVGFSYGAVVSLGSLKLIEWMVRWFLRPELPWNRARVSLLMVLKLPLLTVILAGAAWLSVHGIANVFALVGGLALAPAVIFLKTAGAGLLTALPDQPTPVGWMAEIAARAQRPKPARQPLTQPAPGGGVPRSGGAGPRGAAGGGFVLADPHFNGGPLANGGLLADPHFKGGLPAAD